MENERFILQTFQWNQTARKWMNSSPSIDEIHIKCMTLSFKFLYFRPWKNNSVRDYIQVINETSLFNDLL